MWTQKDLFMLEGLAQPRLPSSKASSLICPSYKDLRSANSSCNFIKLVRNFSTLAMLLTKNSWVYQFKIRMRMFRHGMLMLQIKNSWASCHRYLKACPGQSPCETELSRVVTSQSQHSQWPPKGMDSWSMRQTKDPKEYVYSFTFFVDPASRACSFWTSLLGGTRVLLILLLVPSSMSSSTSWSVSTGSGSSSPRAAAHGSVAGSPKSKDAACPVVLSTKVSSFSSSKLPVVCTSTQYSLMWLWYLSRLHGG